MGEATTTLWQINISHYAEKARWALDYKEVAHLRRSPPPAVHFATALLLSRGTETTLPIMKLDGRTICGSTAIIAALEESHPEPSLYPADPSQRERALELEEFFDEELGPHVRLFLWHEMLSEPEMCNDLAALTFPKPLANSKGLTGGWTRAFVISRYGVKSDAAAEASRAKILSAMDRLDAELAANGGEYLVGDGFTVADLTAASLFNPLVGAEEGPLPPGLLRVPPSYERLAIELSERPGFGWVLEMFKRHRNRAQPVTVAGG